MATHKYKVGQSVRFTPTRMSSLAGSQACKITRLLPIQDGVWLYRIQCLAENVERVAKEGELQVTPLA